MMNAFFKRLICVALSVATVLSLSACGKKNKGDKIDTSKTQLFIYNYTAGYGDEWLNRLETAFEQKYADYEFEPGTGKKGVQVTHRGDMKIFTNSAEIKASAYDIFFLENAPYYSLFKGGLEDLSSIVSKKGEDTDSLTILEKLDKQQKDYYGVKDGNTTKYYGLPSYFGNYGIIYNVDLFEEMGYYLAADTTNGVIIGSDADAKKTAGPDGIEGTADDGLPATYDEFFMLCDEIAQYDIPVCWPGQYKQHHLSNLVDNLVSDYEGVDQMRLNYDFNGRAKDLVVIENGKAKKNADGTFVTEELDITNKNGYELARQAGKLYAMSFIDRLLGNTDYYNKKDALESDSISQTMNQQTYLQAGTPFSKLDKHYAMLIDGPWWQEEAKEVFAKMGESDSKYSRENRKFGWMPLPKATKDLVGTKGVYSDYLNAFVCVKAGLDENIKNAALEFVKFAASDRMLRDFTVTTGAVKAYTYDLTSEDMGKLSTFSAQLVDCIKKSDIVYKYSSSEFYNKNLTYLAYDVVYTANVNGKRYKNIVDGIYEGGTTGEGYFVSCYQYMTDYTFWKD